MSVFLPSNMTNRPLDIVECLTTKFDAIYSSIVEHEYGNKTSAHLIQAS